MAVILITHDLGVVAEIADEVIVMYAGRVVERGARADLLRPPAPVHVGPPRLGTRTDQPRGRRLAQIKGQPPSLLAPPEGCHVPAALPARVRPVPQGPAA